MAKDGGFKVSVPVMVHPHDPKSIATFTFSLSAKVIYDERKQPVSINLNVEMNGWNCAVPPPLERIPTKIIVPQKMAVEYLACHSPVQTSNGHHAVNNLQESKCGPIDSNIWRANNLLGAILGMTGQEGNGIATLNQFTGSMPPSEKEMSALRDILAPPSDRSPLPSLPQPITLPSIQRTVHTMRLPTSLASSQPSSLSPSPPYLGVARSHSFSHTSFQQPSVSSSTFTPPHSSPSSSSAVLFSSPVVPPQQSDGSSPTAHSVHSIHSRDSTSGHSTPCDAASTSRSSCNDDPQTTNPARLSPPRKRTSEDSNGSRIPRVTEMISLLRRKAEQYADLMSRLGNEQDSNTLSCSQCNIAVPNSPNTLLQHLSKHLAGKQLFRCTDCEFASPFSHLIQQHTRVAHPSRSYFEFVDQRHKFDQEMSEMAFKCFFDFSKFAGLPG